MVQFDRPGAKLPLCWGKIRYRNGTATGTADFVLDSTSVYVSLARQLPPRMGIFRAQGGLNRWGRGVQLGHWPILLGGDRLLGFGPPGPRFRDSQYFCIKFGDGFSHIDNLQGTVSEFTFTTSDTGSKSKISYSPITVPRLRATKNILYSTGTGTVQVCTILENRLPVLSATSSRALL